MDKRPLSPKINFTGVQPATRRGSTNHLFMPSIARLMRASTPFQRASHSSLSSTGNIFSAPARTARPGPGRPANASTSTGAGGDLPRCRRSICRPRPRGRAPAMRVPAYASAFAPPDLGFPRPRGPSPIRAKPYGSVLVQRSPRSTDRPRHLHHAAGPVSLDKVAAATRRRARLCGFAPESLVKDADVVKGPGRPGRRVGLIPPLAGHRGDQLGGDPGNGADAT